VWGGDDGIAAAYSPATNSWRLLPPAPIGGYADTIATWTGSRWLLFDTYPVFVATGKRHAVAGASYDPATNRWTPTAPPPVAGVGQVAWTGSQAIVVTAEATESYNPVTNHWTLYAPPPSAAGQFLSSEGRTPVWSGSRLYIPLGGSFRVTGRSVLGLAVFDPATSQWTVSRAPAGVNSAVLEWFNGQIAVLPDSFLPSGAVGTFSDTTPLDGVSYAYEPATNTWRRLATAALVVPMSIRGYAGPPVWTGREAIYWGGGTQALAYNAAADTWYTFAVPNGGLADGNTVEVWTGTEMLAWSYNPGSRVFAVRPPH
jgi:hypothetical protein